MDLDVSLRDYIIIIKLSIHLSIQFKKKKKTPKFDFKIPKNPPPFSFDPNNSNDPKNSRLFPAHKLSLVFHFTYSPHSPIFVSSPPRPPLSKGRLICDRCQNLNSYGPFEHYYALLLPGATRRSLRSQCIRRRPPWVSRQGWTMSPSHDRFPPHPAEKLSSLFSGDKSRRSVRLILCGFADGLQIGCGRSV